MHHSLDRKGRVDLEQLDLVAFPELAKLKNRGLEAELLPADLLFLPMSRSIKPLKGLRARLVPPRAQPGRGERLLELLVLRH